MVIAGTIRGEGRRKHSKAGEWKRNRGNGRDSIVAVGSELQNPTLAEPMRRKRRSVKTFISTAHGSRFLRVSTKVHYRILLLLFYEIAFCTKDTTTDIAEGHTTEVLRPLYECATLLYPKY